MVAVQYSTESRQASANPSRVAIAKDAAATSTARMSRRRTKYSRNTAGVSFSAIASPTRAPRGHGVRRGTQSAITRVIRTTLIWPKEKFAWMGSRYFIAHATAPAASQPRHAHAGSRTCQLCATSIRFNTIHTETRSNTQVNTLMATLAACSDTRASGANAIADSGG